MVSKIFLAIVQAATEFLPISSSGHLAILSNIISEPNLYFISVLHAASLIAVIIFTRKELWLLISFNKPYRRMWLYLILATIPAVLVGLLFKDVIERMFSSVTFVGIAFIFTGFILLITRFARTRTGLSPVNSLAIGLFQALALFPGVSRSGMTISSALFFGIEKEKAAKFSFLLFIPLSLGALVVSAKDKLYIDAALVISFITCAVFSLIFLNLLYIIVKKGKFWMFSFYCLAAGVVTLLYPFFTGTR